MIDLRVWRFGLLAVPLALIITMFSLRDVPPALEPGIPPDAFDASVAAPMAKDLAEQSPNPAPGSAADNAIAETVKAQFAAIAGATVSEQRFDGSFRGRDVQLRNLIAVLPGTSTRQIALIAPRDVAAGSGALTSTAATAAMLEIAQSFSGSSHQKTLVFVSTDGSSIGALGAKRFVSDYTDAGLLDAAIVLSQPAAGRPDPPLVIPWSSGDQSTATQLADTAGGTVSKETGTPAGDEGPLGDLFRLALPSGLGEQAPLVKAGLPAVRISSHGELPLPAGDDVPEKFGTDTFDRFGRAALSLILALDTTDAPVQHGPPAYVGLAGNLLPGWTIALLALALLAPVAAAAGSGLAAAARTPAEALRGLLWSLLRALPFISALLFFYGSAVVGLMPNPEFPFDPATESLGVTGTAVVVAALLLYGTVAFFLRPLRPPPADAVATATPAALLLAAVAVFGVWIANPYLGLLSALGLQAWLAAAARLAGGRAAVIGFVMLGLIPLLLLIGNLAGRFDAGIGVWRDLALMLADGQIGPGTTFLGCLGAGAGIALIAAAATGGPAAPAPELRIKGEISVRRQRPPEPEPADEPEPGPEPEPEPAQPEPERDPRLWSKPVGSSSPPSGSRRLTPRPSTA